MPATFNNRMAITEQHGGEGCRAPQSPIRARPFAPVGPSGGLAATTRRPSSAGQSFVSRQAERVDAAPKPKISMPDAHILRTRTQQDDAVTDGNFFGVIEAHTLKRQAVRTDLCLAA